jgi:phosphate transport system permease protein
VLKKIGYAEALFFTAAAILVLASVGLIVFIGAGGLALFTAYPPADFFFGTEWNQSTHVYGVIPLLYGSIMTTLITLLISVPLGLLVAIFMVEIAPPPMRRVMRTTVELFASLPSVIFGLLALTIVVPMVRVLFHAPLGKGILPAAIILIFMTQPTIVTITEDALRSAAAGLREGAMALGSTRWQMISGVLVPAARQGILTAVILGTGRAVGETMAVQMVIGNITTRIPPDLVSGATTMPAAIVTQLPEAAAPETRSALIMVGFLLLLITFALIAIARRVSSAGTTRKKAKRRAAPQIQTAVTPLEETVREVTA